jgi:hypothetical protein
MKQQATDGTKTAKVFQPAGALFAEIFKSLERISRESSRGQSLRGPAGALYFAIFR